MESATELVVKVTYGDVLRRFRVPFKANGQLDLEMAGLREKIAGLFNLPVDAEFLLTYLDEDGDVVALVDDNDLFDVTNQRLKFLKINVQLKTGAPDNPSAPMSSGSSTPASSSHSRNHVSKLQKGINDVLMAVPTPMRDGISKVYMDLASKAACSSPVVGEMLDCISKLAQVSIPKESSPGSPVTGTFGGDRPGSSGHTLNMEVFPGEQKDISKETSTNLKTVKMNEPSSFADSKTTAAVPTSSGPSASFNECPFSGNTVNDCSPNPFKYKKKHARAECYSKKSNTGDYWTSLGMFHKGIRCDGCGVLPITGPRFKSKVKEDYDLCTICFSVMGNEKEYTRMDKPASAHHTRPFRGQFSQFPSHWISPPVPQLPRESAHFRCGRPKLDSRFVVDVNVHDGTVVAPSAPFTKIWRMRNNGSVVWPRGTQIVWTGGDQFSSSLAVDLQIPEEGLPINSELDVAADFIAPELPGRYISYWKMASSNGVKFGQRVWVLINVDASLKSTVMNEFHGLNLNATPDENFTGEFRLTEAIPESTQAGSSNVHPGIMKVADPEPQVDESQAQKTDIPVDCEVHPATETLDVAVPLQEDVENNDVEKIMLKELEEMGFKEVDLNKEILRGNKYNLEESIDALCGVTVTDWDPILEELQEMGFCDDETNKRLLKKNNGSIKGVVMDLLTG